MTNRSYSTSRKRKTQEGGQNKPFPMIKIDNENLVDLLDEIVNFIPELRDMENPISATTRYIPGNDVFNVLSAIDTTTDVIVQDPDKKVGERKFATKLHVLYCPEIYPLRSGKDTIIPDSVLDSICELTEIQKEIVSYVFRTLHELGHVCASIDHLGYNAELYISIDDMMRKMQDYEYDKYEDRVTVDERQASYRYLYMELFADHFAYKWLIPVLANCDVDQYFETATEEDVKKRDEEEG